jgi:hypothetical protein
LCTHRQKLHVEHAEGMCLEAADQAEGWVQHSASAIVASSKQVVRACVRARHIPWEAMLRHFAVLPEVELFEREGHAEDGDAVMEVPVVT